jgi:hypothetical protein
LSGDFEAATEELARWEAFGRELERLREKMSAVDKEAVENTRLCPEWEVRWELAAAHIALSHVLHFLRAYAPSVAVDRLNVAVAGLINGQRAAMLAPVSPGYRAEDVPTVQAIKGILAGIMAAKQKNGMERAQAAAWVARNIAPELAARISRKPITARAVQVWRDRYGKKSASESPGNRAFEIWSNPEPDRTSAHMLDTTRRLASCLPVLKEPV